MMTLEEIVLLLIGAIALTIGMVWLVATTPPTLI
jgi:hypothetical protein